MADTDCIVIMGFNMAENHPVAFLSVMDEYRFAATPPEHTAWLLSGAPSADSEDGKPDAGGIDGERRRKGGFHPDEHWCPICSSDHVWEG